MAIQIISARQGKTVQGKTTQDNTLKAVGGGRKAAACQRPPRCNPSTFQRWRGLALTAHVRLEGEGRSLQGSIQHPSQPHTLLPLLNSSWQ
jgi:hypothetical protein